MGIFISIQQWIGLVSIWILWAFIRCAPGDFLFSLLLIVHFISLLFFFVGLDDGHFLDSVLKSAQQVASMCPHVFPSDLVLFRVMFSNVGIQGRFFAAFFSFVFTSMDDPILFRNRLHQLAVSHFKKGVKAVEYGIIGEVNDTTKPSCHDWFEHDWYQVLFWTLKTCLQDLYDKATHRAWVKLYSSMLAVIVPVAVKYELTPSVMKSTHKPQERIQTDSHSFSWKTVVAESNSSSQKKHNRLKTFTESKSTSQRFAANERSSKVVPFHENDECCEFE